MISKTSTGAFCNYRKGEWVGIRMAWNDARRILTLRLAAGSRMLPPARRDLTVKLGDTTHTAVCEGRPLEIRL